MAQTIYNGVLASFDIATDLVSAVHYQELKMRWGGAGVVNRIDDSTPPPFRAPRVAAATVTEIDDAASSTTLAASNANRLGLIIENLSSAFLYIKFGTGAAVSGAGAHTLRLGTGDVFEMGDPIYTGAVTGIWASNAGGFAYVTEM